MAFYKTPRFLKKSAFQSQHQSQPYSEGQEVLVSIAEIEQKSIPCVPSPNHRYQNNPPGEVPNNSLLTYIQQIQLGPENELMEFSYKNQPILIGLSMLPYLKIIKRDKPKRRRRSNKTATKKTIEKKKRKKLKSLGAYKKI